MGMPRAWRAALRRRWWALAATAAVLASLCLRLPAEDETREYFPRVPPHVLAHMLADFSHQPNVGSWSVVEDGGNYTTWRYAVKYECGAGCAGHATVEAHDAPRSAAPEHGPSALHHRVAVSLRACKSWSPLSWPTFCDETETVALVSRSADGAGCELATQWRARCAAPAVLSGSCASALRAHRNALLRRVRSALRA